MARQGLGQGQNDPETPEKDEVDELFDKIEAKECDIDDIDPSKKGWEIFIHFGDVDPRISGTEAHDDFTTFTYLEKFCLAKCEYKEGTRTLVLSYLDGCCEDQFSPEHIQLMQKYSPHARAPEHDQKSAAKTLPPPPSIKVNTRDSAADILASVGAMQSKPPIIREISDFIDNAIDTALAVAEKIPPEKPKNPEIPDDYLITIPMKGTDLEDMLEAVKCADVDELLKKLEEIAAEENLEFMCAMDEENYLVNIYKKTGSEYQKPMSHKNLVFILKLPYSKVEYEYEKA